MKRIYLILALLLLLTLAACGEKTSTPSPSDTPTVTDPHQPIEVQAGSEFTITVETAGQSSELHWEVAVALDTAVVDYVWKDFVPQNRNNLTGSGWDVWKFKAIAPGTTTISLGYYRGLTEETAQMAVFTIIVK